MHIVYCTPEITLFTTENLYVKAGMVGKTNDFVTESAEFEDCLALAYEPGTSISKVSTLAVIEARELLQR